jgi:hypothetical protein
MRTRDWLLGFAAMLLSAGLAAAGPYAPAAGEVGSTAIWKDDPSLVGWATGWQDYVVGANCGAGWQTPELALGKAVGNDFDVVSLGEGGRITMTFAGPIVDGPGWDFAVFENTFWPTYLEFAYVEVSSNGVDFFRFANDSLTPLPNDPVNNPWAYLCTDPTDTNGLAGKYFQGYGTPFDLAELAGVSPLLDMNDVQYVRLVDVIGDGSCLDTSGGPIYDPFPTYDSAGFDLDAVGVIYQTPEPGGLGLLMVLVLGLAAARR